MAITKEQLDGLKPEGFDETQWSEVSSKFMALHDSDVNGLVTNEANLKAEKVAIKEKYDSLNNSFAAEKTAWAEKEKALNANLEELNKKINDGSEGAQALELAYQQKEKTLTDAYAKQKEEYEKQIQTLTGQVTTLEKSAFENECKDAFSKAIVGKNLDSNNLEAIKTLALGENFSKFSKKSIGDGKYIITRDDGKDIAASVDEFISSSAGKLFVVNGNSGGGADGGNDNPPPATTMKWTDFQRLSPSEQAEAATKYKLVD